MKKRSDWQLAIIRAALRAYKEFTPGRRGTGLYWAEVAGDIEGVTEIECNGEMLRQFVEGVSKRQHPVRYRLPDAAVIEAVVDFLCSEEIAGLSRDELEDDRYTAQAPHRFADFLSLSFGNDEPVSAPEILEGRYVAMTLENDVTVSMKIVMRRDADGRFFLVEETHEAKSIPLRTDHKRKGHKTPVPKNRTERFRGWCVMTPEGNLIFAMKERAYGVNHFWMLVQELDIYGEMPPDKLCLLRHHYPAEARVYTDNITLRKELMMHIPHNIAIFSRPDAIVTG